MSTGSSREQIAASIAHERVQRILNEIEAEVIFLCEHFIAETAIEHFHIAFNSDGSVALFPYEDGVWAIEYDRR